MTPNLAAAKLRGVEIDVGATLLEVCQLRRQCCVVAFGASHLPLIVTAYSAAEWSAYHIIGIVVVERVAKETPNDWPIGGWRDRRTRVYVGGGQVVVCVSWRLRAGEVDVVDRGGKRHRRLRGVEAEGRRTERRRPASTSGRGWVRRRILLSVCHVDDEVAGR